MTWDGAWLCEAGELGLRAKQRARSVNEDVMISRTSWFARFAQHVSHITGRPTAFVFAVAVILVWSATGPIFGYSDTWQLIINTGTTIVTFLMVFVIQNTQNRDTAAMHIKIDELIRVTGKARNILIDLEELDDRDLETLRKDFERLAEEGRHRAHSTELPHAKVRQRHRHDEGHSR
jgi:low affinity Fe/Cu permease